MYLKDLTLRGFKSFASATRFRFEPGINAIIGPNGSGKSNVVDALAWVMGEQGAKSLRGGAMADVIFAGGTDRPALGRAQVELTIDNSDGKLPIAYSEVTISRTMFRSGGSEYAINNQPVRLLDVQELLSDSGLGRQMHVIVGQGQLDAVLAATPQQRRAFIDEAAGVAKHRRRKERALRKLESMDANLVRVLDLTEELRAGLRPLARQAKAAKQAAGVRDEMLQAKGRLLAFDLSEAARKLAAEKKVLAALRQQNEGASQRIEALQATLVEAEREASEGQAHMEAASELHRDFLQAAQGLASVGELARERAHFAAQVPLPISEDSVDLGFQRAQEAEEEAQALAVQVKSKEEAAKEASAARQGLQQQLDEQRRSLRGREAEHERARETYMRGLRQLEGAQARKQTAEKQVMAAQQRELEAARALAAAEAAVGPAPASGKDGSATSDQAELPEALAYEQAAARLQSARQAVEQAEATERQAAAEQSKAAASRDALEETLAAENQEPAQPPQGSLGPLQGLLKVERGWEDAVAALLGPLTRTLVIEQGVSLADLVRDLPPGLDAQTAAVSGYLTQPASAHGAPGERDGQPAPTGGSAGCLLALDVVQVEEPARTAAEQALQNCYVAPTAEAAVAFLTEGSGEAGAGEDARVGLPSGEVLTANAVLLPGRPGRSELHLRAALADATEAAHVQQATLARARAATVAARDQFDAATADHEGALTALRKADAERARDAQKQARAEAYRQAAAQDLQRAVEAHSKAQQDLAQAAETAEQLAQSAGEPPVSADEALGEQRQEVERIAALVENAFSEENQARMDHHVIRERHAALERQARAFAANARTMKEDRGNQLRRQQQSQAQVEQLQNIATQAEEGAKQARDLADNAAARKRQLQSERDDRVAHAARVRNQVEELRVGQARGGDDLLQSEVTYAQLSSAREQLLQEAVEFAAETGGQAAVTDNRVGEQGPPDAADPGVGQADATEDPTEWLLANYGPHHPWLDEQGNERPFSRQEAKRALDKANRELSRLGVVNPLAVEEYEAASARYEFLLEQVEDLNRSKADLLDLIQEVDRQVELSFEDAYGDVAERFSQVFQRLFPGGVGKLELTEPDDPLTTGVEIYARPKGKRVTRLSLLSGGERSLAALAYLIAIFQARPSPFYVLDEVEAALDDVNLSRVLSLLEDLKKESQLLIITHQKRTMEIADALYGVSMRGGVTAVMSHKMA